MSKGSNFTRQTRVKLLTLQMLVGVGKWVGQCHPAVLRVVYLHLRCFFEHVSCVEKFANKRAEKFARTVAALHRHHCALHSLFVYFYVRA